MAPRKGLKPRMLDFGKLGEAVQRPGIDPRTWVATARVDDDPDAISYVAGVGWVIDVTFTGSTLDEQGPIPCRVTSSFAADALGRSEPQVLGKEVLVLIPDGNVNANPVIVGYLHNEDGCSAPTEVNGTAIDEAYALATHIFVTDKAVDEQVGGKHRTIADGDAILVGDRVELGDESLGADDGVVQGTAIDPFTGLTYFALGSSSSKVFAKK